MNLKELFNLATEGWSEDEIEILRNDIKAQIESRSAWIITLKNMVAFEDNVKLINKLKGRNGK